MIQLTDEQREAVHKHPGQPVHILDAASRQTFVLIPGEMYERMTAYDDSPWTDAEMDALAVEVDQMLDDDMAIEDPLP
jgi:hypothetical protein